MFHGGHNLISLLQATLLSLAAALPLFFSYYWWSSPVTVEPVPKWRS